MGAVAREGVWLGQEVPDYKELKPKTFAIPSLFCSYVWSLCAYQVGREIVHGVARVRFLEDGFCEVWSRVPH